MKIRDNNINNSAIQFMENDLDIQNDFMIGSFWYDIDNNELFGIDQVPASSRDYYYSRQFNTQVRTGPILHQTRWKKEAIKRKDKRFSGDYTKVPRGRVFDYKNLGPVVFTGNWINQYPQVKQLIIDEFDLPDNVIFCQDEHGILDMVGLMNFNHNNEIIDI